MTTQLRIEAKNLHSGKAVDVLSDKDDTTRFGRLEADNRSIEVTVWDGQGVKLVEVDAD